MVQIYDRKRCERTISGCVVCHYYPVNVFLWNGVIEHHWHTHVHMCLLSCSILCNLTFHWHWNRMCFSVWFFFSSLSQTRLSSGICVNRCSVVCCCVYCVTVIHKIRPPDANRERERARVCVLLDAERNLSRFHICVNCHFVVESISCKDILQFIDVALTWLMFA